MKKVLLVKMVFFLLFVLVAISSARMDKPLVEPQMQPPGYGPAAPVCDEQSYQGCTDDWTWAKGAQNPQQCMSCVTGCVEKGSATYNRRLFCRRTCLYSGKCRF